MTPALRQAIRSALDMPLLSERKCEAVYRAVLESLEPGVAALRWEVAKLAAASVTPSFAEADASYMTSRLASVRTAIDALLEKPSWDEARPENKARAVIEKMRDRMDAIFAECDKPSAYYDAHEMAWEKLRGELDAALQSAPQP